MTRSSQFSLTALISRSALNFACVALLAVAVAPLPTCAQRGERGSGGHFAGGHGGGAHFGGGYPGGMHFGSTARRASAHAQASPHLTYIPRSGGRPTTGTWSRNVFMNRRHSHQQQVPFQGPFDFLGNVGNGFFWPPFGFWPGWGWDWGWGGGWDEGWWGGCDYYPENCYSGQDSSGYPEAREQSDYDVETEEARPMITVYLNDGSGYGALDYWTRNGTFYIETTYGAEKSFPMDQVDLKRTFTENTARGVTFSIFPYPSTSDPGPMLAPDSYAPDCPSPSQASPAGASAVAGIASANEASWFGATGRISDRGLA